MSEFPVTYPLDGAAGTFDGKVRQRGMVGLDQANMGTSLIRISPPPSSHRRALGIFLL